MKSGRGDKHCGRIPPSSSLSSDLFVPLRRQGPLSVLRCHVASLARRSRIASPNTCPTTPYTDPTDLLAYLHTSLFPSLTLSAPHFHAFSPCAGLSIFPLPNLSFEPTPICDRAFSAHPIPRSLAAFAHCTSAYPFHCFPTSFLSLFRLLTALHARIPRFAMEASDRASGPTAGSKSEERTKQNGPRPKKEDASDSSTSTGSKSASRSSSATTMSPDDAKPADDSALAQENGVAPKPSRKSSKLPPRNPPQLFNHLPDATEEACRTFQVISDCLYGSRNMGSSDHDALDCDCAEDWRKYQCHASHPAFFLSLAPHVSA